MRSIRLGSLAIDPTNLIGGGSSIVGQGTAAPSTGTAADDQPRSSRDGSNGCPCRTETSTIQRTVVIPVRQTRIICDTPPPSSIVPPCDEVTAAVRQQLNEQGVQGLSGLADGNGGGIVDLAFKVGVGVLIGYMVWGR
jgi:hypothetical protein